MLCGLILVWWRKEHAQLSGPQFKERIHARRGTALRELLQPLRCWWCGTLMAESWERCCVDAEGIQGTVVSP
jgi:hypothetical protein